MKDIETLLKQKEQFTPVSTLPDDFASHVVARLSDAPRKRSILEQIKETVNMKTTRKMSMAALSVLALAGLGGTTYAVIMNWPAEVKTGVSVVKTLPNGTRIIKITDMPKECGDDRARVNGDFYYAYKASVKASPEAFNGGLRKECNQLVDQRFMDKSLDQARETMVPAGYATASGDGIVQSVSNNSITIKNKYGSSTYKIAKQVKLYENTEPSNKNVLDLKPGNKISYLIKDTQPGRSTETEGENSVSRKDMEFFAAYIVPNDKPLPSEPRPGFNALVSLFTGVNPDDVISVVPDAQSEKGFKPVYDEYDENSF